MAKKFIVTSSATICNTTEEVSRYINKLVNNGIDISTIVVGTYMGTPEISSNICVKLTNDKKKRLPSVIQTKAKVSKPAKPKVTSDQEDDEEDLPQPTGPVKECSFCGKPATRMLTVQGMETALCDYHANLEDKLRTIA